MLLLLSAFLQAQNKGNTHHSCMDEAPPALYDWKEIENKFSKQLHISSTESKNFFRYAVKYSYLSAKEYLVLVKEGAISTKNNAQQYWLNKLPYLEEVYKFKYLAEQNQEAYRNGTGVNRTESSSCNNLDFSAGNTSNWVGKWNQVSGGPGNNAYGNLTVNGFNSSISGYNDMGFVHEICNSGTDRNVPVNKVPPGHTFSLRLGDDSAYIQNIHNPSTFPYNHQTISNTFSVTSASQTITY